MEEDRKRHLYIIQHQQKQKSRQQRKKNKGNIEKENKGGHRIQERRRWKEAAGLIRGQPKI